MLINLILLYLIFFLMFNQIMYKIMIFIFLILYMMLILTFKLKFSWMNIIYCILMISGLMILFMYMSSTEMKNEILKFKNKYFLIYLFLIIFFLKEKLNLDFLSIEKVYLILNLNGIFIIFFSIIYMLIMLFFSIEMLIKFKNVFRMKF